jgi:hypothetical protein
VERRIRERLEEIRKLRHAGGAKPPKAESYAPGKGPKRES